MKARGVYRGHFGPFVGYYAVTSRGEWLEPLPRLVGDPSFNWEPEVDVPAEHALAVASLVRLLDSADPVQYLRLI